MGADQECCLAFRSSSSLLNLLVRFLDPSRRFSACTLMSPFASEVSENHCMAYLAIAACGDSQIVFFLFEHHAEAAWDRTLSHARVVPAFQLLIRVPVPFSSPWLLIARLLER